MRVGSRPSLILLSRFALLLALAPGFALAQTRVRRNVEVEWESVKGASLYEVQIIRQDDKHKKPTRLTTHEPRWSATIKPGTYTFQVRSYDERGVPGDWSPPSDLPVHLPSVVMIEPKPGEAVQAPEDENHPMKFSWEDVPGADHYKVSVRSTTSDWHEEKEVSESTAEVKVPVGEKIEWNVAAVDKKGETGEVNPVPQGFETKGPALKKPAVEPPLSKYVEEVEWKPTPNAKAYNYELSYKNPKTNKWEKVESKTGLPEAKLKWNIKRPSGKYRLKVQAQAERRGNSPVAKMEFETRGGFRDPAALQTAILRDSISKPTNFYAIASYLVTDVKYKAANYDTNTTPTFSALGGTGRIGLGYQDPDSLWGGFGILDLSGFAIGGQNFTFAAAENHVTYKLEFGQGGLLQFGTGLFFKELPILKGSSIIGFTGVGKVRQIGPHGGFTYWMPLSQRWGVQANARIYYSLLGTSTPGPSAKPSMSYQYGLLGSYRMSPAWMGYAGYAFRKDVAQYGVSPGTTTYSSPGEVNQIELQGHYVNLILEFSF